MINDKEIKHRETEFELPIQMTEWTRVIKLQLNMNVSISALVKASVELLMIKIQLRKEEISVHQSTRLR